MLGSLIPESNRTSIKLRDYQLQSAQHVLQEWDRGKRNVCLVMGMGGGKTSTCGWIVNEYLKQNPQGRALIVCHMRKLVRQFADSIENAFGIPTSLEMSGHKDEGYPVLSATVQTITAGIARGRWSPHEFGLIVMDESHLSLAPQFQAVSNHFRNARILGPTATPHRASGEDLRSFFDGWVELPEAQMESLILNGYLSPITIKKIPVKIRIEHDGAGDVTDQECAHAIEPYLASAADSIAEHSVNRCGFVFLPLIATSKRFVDMLRDRGVRAEHVDGSMEESDVNAAIRRLERNEVDIICNSQLMGIGVDVPCVDFVCILRPTSSWAVYCQQVGRGLRLFEGSKYRPPKRDCILLDVIFETERHNLLQTPECLISSDPEERELIKKFMYNEDDELSLDLIELKERAASAREDALRKRMEEVSARRAEIISAVDFFRGSGLVDLAKYAPKSEWDTMPPTKHQVDAMQRLGIDVHTVENRGQANELMKEIVRRASKGYCSLDQVKQCFKLGHDDPWGLSRAEAKQFIESRQ